MIELILKSFIDAGVLQEEEYDIYHYCFDILISKLLFCTIILGLALFLGQVPVTLTYYLGFSIIRYTCGGYHANSPAGCYALSTGIYLASLCLIYIVSMANYQEAFLSTLFCAVLLVWWLAPVDHPNKRFSLQEKFAYRKKGRIAIIYCVLFATVLWPINELLSWSFTVGIAVAALSVAAAVKKNKGDDLLC